MDSAWLRVLGAVALLAPCAEGAVSALSVPPSPNWYGSDGEWSTVSIRVGTPPQWVDVMVSTVSSETWVVGAGGCSPSDTQCSFLRGGTFEPSASSTWRELGLYVLGADQHLGNDGYGQYGLDSLTFGGTGVTIPSAIIGAFNGTGQITATSYMLGLLGLGVVPGGFNKTTPLSTVSALVEETGVIPSHSWGYTAGAKYQQKGTVNSLTLGGYDTNRFVEHNVTFNLNAGKQLLTYLNDISVSSSGTSNEWTTPVQLLSTADQVSAIIDSSTPYLWLPPTVCQRFAQTLGLTYNNSLNLYTFDGNASRRDTLVTSQLSFDFTLADVSSTPSTVTITLPYAAFDLRLTYPAIPNTSFGDADATKYYFPLRQAANDAQFTIGRVFLQEAYLITDYERNTFSVHQAIHPTDSVNNQSIVDILPPDHSAFTGNPKGRSDSTLSTGAIAGIVVGVLAGVLASAIFFICRRKRQNAPDKEFEKPLSSAAPDRRSVMDRVIRRRTVPQTANVHEASGSSLYATEVAADATHEVFELPAPLGPVELDSDTALRHSLDGSTEYGVSTQDSLDLSAYERARRKIERQQGAIAEAEGSSPGPYPVEKSEADMSQLGYYHTPDAATQRLPDSAGPDLPAIPPPVYQHINPANVVYAGRLPNNVHLPNVIPGAVGRDGLSIIPPQGGEPSPTSTNRRSSFGSRYTAEEPTFASAGLSDANSPHIVSPLASSPSESGSGGRGIDKMSSWNGSSPGTSRPVGEAGGLSRGESVFDQWGSRRRLDGEDLVHVPQLPDKRFSWED